LVVVELVDLIEEEEAEAEDLELLLDHLVVVDPLKEL
jgi:hypothetical protein